MHSLLTSIMMVLGSLALAQVLAPAPDEAREQAHDLTLSVVSMALTLNGERMLMQTADPQNQSAFGRRDPGLAADVDTLKHTWRVVDTAEQKLQLYDGSGEILAVIDLAENPPKMIVAPQNGAPLNTIIFTPEFLKLEFSECHLPKTQISPPDVHEKRQLRPICDTVAMSFILEDTITNGMAAL